MQFATSVAAGGAHAGYLSVDKKLSETDRRGYFRDKNGNLKKPGQPGTGKSSLKKARKRFNKKVAQNKALLKATTFVSRTLSAVSIGTSLLNIIDSGGSQQSLARFGVAAFTTGLNIIPVAGGFLSVGVAILDANGTFDEFYKQFSNERYF